jgi:quercetin dioxygenase-like cupin family protein
MSLPKEIIKVGSVEFHFLLDGDNTNDTMVVFEAFFPPGVKVSAPSHSHADVDEVVLGLEGTLCCTINGKHINIKPEDRYFIPRGTVHHFQNNTDETVKVLGIMTPAFIGPPFFREMSTLIEEGSNPEKAKEIMLRYGLVPETEA